MAWNQKGNLHIKAERCDSCNYKHTILTKSLNTSENCQRCFQDTSWSLVFYSMVNSLAITPQLFLLLNEHNVMLPFHCGNL